MKKAISIFPCNAVISRFTALLPADESAPAQAVSCMMDINGSIMRTCAGAFRLTCIPQ